MTPNLRALIFRSLLWLAVIWLAVLTLSYYGLRQPFSGGVGAVMLANLTDLLAVAALLLLAGALGAAILRDVLGGLSNIEQAALWALLGLGAISLAVLVLGLVGRYPPGWAAWAISLGMLAILWRQARRWLGALRAGLRDSLDTGGRWFRTFTGWLIVLVIALIAVSLALALMPVNEWDSLVYHLGGPREYLRAGRIISFPEMHFLGFPFLAEMLYLWLMLLARPQAAALLHACFGLLALLLLIGAARRMGHPASGWLAALILLVDAEIQYEFHVAFSDLPAMAYTAAAFLLLLSAYPREREPDRRLLAWAGVFAGLAMGTKYTLAPAAVGLGMLTLWLARRDGLAGMLRAALTLVIPALAVFAPWLIKNVLMYGNPVAPFVWGTSAFDALDQRDYLQAGTGLPLPRLIFAPIEMTILGDTPLWRYGASPGPLLLGLLPTALIGWKARSGDQRGFLICAAIFCLPGVLWWYAGAAVSGDLVSIRLLYPIFPAAALISGFGLEGLRDVPLPIPLRRLGRGLALAAGVGSLVISSLFTLANANALRVSAGLMPEGDFLAEALPAYYTAMGRVNTLPSDARVLMLWESRVFYCQRACIPDSLLNRWWHDHQLEPDPHRIADSWRREGITHVLIFDAGMNHVLALSKQGGRSLRDEDIAALDIVRRDDLTLLWDGADAYDAYKLYALKPVP